MNRPTLRLDRHKPLSLAPNGSLSPQVSPHNPQSHDCDNAGTYVRDGVAALQAPTLHVEQFVAIRTCACPASGGFPSTRRPTENVGAKNARLCLSHRSEYME